MAKIRIILIHRAFSVEICFNNLPIAQGVYFVKAVNERKVIAVRKVVKQ